MPLKSSYGFLTPNATPRDAAHELGHGVFNFRHTFSSDNIVTLPEGETQNLMDYSGGTDLYKYQWDYAHDPESGLFVFEDSEEGATTFTPINNNYTALFNHVYKNHNENNYFYLNKINDTLSSGVKDFKLKYTSEESSKWLISELTFINEWKIRVLDSFEHIQNIIKNIQDTEDGKKIGKINLRSKNIYLSKIIFDGYEYPVAIYGNGTSSVLEDVFIKREVTDVTELEDKTHIYSIYCDDTPLEYLIIGFYKSGDNTPSMIMQISKFDIYNWLAKKEKWLEYLNIYKPNLKINTEGLLTLFNNGNEIKDPKNFYAFIDTIPSMPDKLSIRFNGSKNDTANIIIKISYRITYNFMGVTYSFDDGVTTTEMKKIESGVLYPLTFTNIRGGTVTTICETKDRISKLMFNIRGENPSKNRVEEYIESKGYLNYWFINAITTHESSFMQFCFVNKSTFSIINEKNTYEGPYIIPEGQKGLPLYGGPRGFGLKQLDNWGNNKICSGDQRWNWKANIDGGLEVIATKIKNVNDHYTDKNWVTKVKDWNNENEDKITMNEYTFGGTINTEVFTYSDSPLFPNLNFTGINPTAGKHSFLDAILIKKFNGGRYILILEEPPVDPENPLIPIKPYWKLISTYLFEGKTIDNLKYINDVCNKN